MRIQNNIMAMNAQRQLSISTGNLNQSLERLSSGFRINRAADDAAGLAISQAFRAEIASFKVASRNVSEANSLLQLAEGSMTQMGNILTRLKELATQASSGNAGANITKINAEANELVIEFDRIVTSTQYAGRELLTGNLAPSIVELGDVNINTATSVESEGTYFGYEVSGETGASISADISSVVASLGTSVWDIDRVDETNNFTITIDHATSTLSFSAELDGGNLTIAGMGEDGTNLVIGGIAQGAADLDGETLTFTSLGFNEDNISVSSNATAGSYTLSTTAGGDFILTGSGENQGAQIVSGPDEGVAGTVNFSNLGISINLETGWSEGSLDGFEIVVSETSAGGNSMSFQIGSLNRDDNRISINLSDTRASVMNLTQDMLISEQAAQLSLTVVDEAIGKLSDARGDIGAYMNRLKYASANLSTIIENVQAAESVIRDADMAAEMTQFVKNQILAQAGTAMLAQANMAPQMVLSLIA